MKTALQLLAEKRDKAVKAQALIQKALEDDRALTEEEKSEIAELRSRISSLETMIETLEDTKKAIEDVKAAGEGLQDKEDRSAQPGQPPKQADIHVGEPQMRSQWKDLGEFLQAVVNSASNGNRRVDPRLLNADGLKPEERAGLGLEQSNDPTGGFLIDQTLSDELLMKAFDVGNLFPRARQIPIGPGANGIRINSLLDEDRTDGNRAGGILSAWVAEGATTSEGRPQFFQIELNLQKLLAIVYATEEMMQDYTATTSLLQQLLADEIAFQLDKAVYSGDGVGKPSGLLNASCKHVVTRNTPSAVLFSDIVAMETAFYSRGDANGVYVASKAIFPQLMNMSFKTDTGDQYPVFIPMSQGAVDAPRQTLMGRPLIFSEHASTLGTEGDLMLVDMSQYFFARKAGLQQAFSAHIRFNFDEVAFRTTFRATGRSSWQNKITLANGIEESHIVTLSTSVAP